MASTVVCASIVAGSVGAAAADDDTLVGIVVKTRTNPFFVKMTEGAAQAAEEHGVDLRSYAGNYDGDVGSQIEAIESLIAAGADGILLTPSDSSALVPVVERAREAGILVIALDTALTPASAAHATFATDNFEAGKLVGQWARAQLGDAASDARIAMLDLNTKEISVDVARDQGFLTGFGIDVKDPEDIGDEEDPRIVGHDVTQGSAEGGRRAMENLLQRNPGINVVYTINEPAAAGAYEALRSFGFEDQALIVSIDGGCPGVKNVKAGVIGATSMQFPLRMAKMGVDAVVEYADTGKLPKTGADSNFVNTGVELVTDDPVEGVPSISPEEGLEKCWG
nr:substrate-binding domain-containing protein [Rhodovibrio salinarum]